MFFLVMMRAVEAPDKLGSSGNERINSMLATGAASRLWSGQASGRQRGEASRDINGMNPPRTHRPAWFPLPGRRSN